MPQPFILPSIPSTMTYSRKKPSLPLYYFSRLLWLTTATLPLLTNHISCLLHPLWLIPERYHSLYRPLFLSSSITVAHLWDTNTPHHPLVLFPIHCDLFLEYISSPYPDLHSSTGLIRGRHIIPQHHPSVLYSPINWLIPLRYLDKNILLTIHPSWQLPTINYRSLLEDSILPHRPPFSIYPHSRCLISERCHHSNHLSFLSPPFLVDTIPSYHPLFDTIPSYHLLFLPSLWLTLRRYIPPIQPSVLSPPIHCGSFLKDTIPSYHTLPVTHQLTYSWKIPSPHVISSSCLLHQLTCPWKIPSTHTIPLSSLPPSTVIHSWKIPSSHIIYLLYLPPIGAYLKDTIPTTTQPPHLPPSTVAYLGRHHPTISSILPVSTHALWLILGTYLPPTPSIFPVSPVNRGSYPEDTILLHHPLFPVPCTQFGLFLTIATPHTIHSSFLSSTGSFFKDTMFMHHLSCFLPSPVVHSWKIPSPHSIHFPVSLIYWLIPGIYHLLTPSPLPNFPIPLLILQDTIYSH